MQWWLAHSNWLEVQNLSAEGGTEGRLRGRVVSGSFEDVGAREHGRLTAVRLVGPVLTVVLLIAGPAHGDAAAAGAGEEVDRALEFPLVWK